MDCNKEEATRAKEIAESKMLGRDFVVAKKLLLKALQLYPEIENASHMLTVCEVHCSAGNLVNGQTDHYGVLQVEASADEALIKKQYRRLALLLHPDKNKFAGAEAAFKFVGEAYKVLSNQADRQVYDAKRRVQMRASWHSSQNSRNARRYTAATVNVSNSQFSGLRPQDQQLPSMFYASQCFWTMCVFCNNRFQYARPWLNREVQCHKCFKKFYAFEVSPENIPPPGSSSGFTRSHTGTHEMPVPGQRSYNHGSQTRASQPAKPAATKPQHGSGNKEERPEPCGDGMDSNQQKSENSKPENKPSGNARRMRRNRRVVVNSTDSESAESDSTENNSADSISEVEPTVLDGGPTNSRYPRRSTRSKTNVTYREAESEDEDSVPPRKRIRKVGSFGSKNQDISSPVVPNGVKVKKSEIPISEDGIKPEQKDENPCKDNLQRVSVQDRVMEETVHKKDEKQVKKSSNSTSAVPSRSRKQQASSSFSYPDPEFFDFDEERNKSRFAENQVWAVYDDDDGMPRYYALIQKPFVSSFRLQYIWLENNPTSAAEKAWVAAGLPISCGNFTQGKACSTKSQQMFSHLVFSEDIRKDSYSFYPKKGEVWALFKDWDIGWSSAVNKSRNYEYEIVQVVSDFSYGKDITVCNLFKVKGFLYVFAPVHDKQNTVIPGGQLLKFSHCIPHYSLREEGEGIPRDSFELDPAALPESLLKVTDTVSANSVDDKLAGCAVNSRIRGHFSVNSEDILHKSDDATEQHPVDPEKPCNPDRRNETTGSCSLGVESNEDDEEDSSFNGEERKNSEFHNLRSEDKFAKGQIWALYSEIVEFPNYYAWIKKVEWEEAGFVIIKWLEHSPETQYEKLWSKNGLPFGCGTFKVSLGTERFYTTDAFSHVVHAKSIKKNDLYEIYPSSGEVWALYKNWSLMLTSKDIGNAADYSLVEIIQRNESVIRAASLTKVEGYENFFTAETGGLADVKIPIKEWLRFSHLIPAFRRTIKESGKQKECWELDPDSIPKILLS
ncbi:uncharacterized protein LOC110032625 [Phalaenopsis equestris]|uniref:uncharacterized protein LOC110032625 n=1 Tax=Phalaenopsis equestris TaxID=78828 RepID=UPI0009E1A308|nr:uncharacterized protein LOC110032625 [Phalaenopsis equestris]